MFDNSFDSSLSGLGNFSTYLDKDHLSSSLTVSSLQQLPSLNTPVDNAGNTLATARSVGTLTATQSFSDAVGSVDTNDYYSFNVGIQSNLTLSLTGLTANADVQLLNGSGGVITTSAKSGTTSESIASLLNTGTYFVRVYRSSGDTNYSLSLNATPIDNAGNTTATARAVGTLTATQSFSNWVGSLDTNDYYSFNVGTQSNLTLSLTGLTANADVELLNSSGAVITTAAATGTTSESITRLLSTGTYYARVYQSSGDTNYSLSLNATPVDNAGNNTATARAVGTLTATQSFSDWVGSVDTNDYYSFNVGIQSNLTLSLTGLTANADVQLLNGSGGVITTSAKSGTTSESIASLLNTGTYFIRVYQSSGDTNYSLSLNMIEITPNPNPTPEDWYNQNLKDAQIITLTRSLAADGNLSRNDMISIFRDAKDGSVIDANELTDLRTLVSNSTLFTMADSVKVLSNKIANSDVANTRSGFGNLSAGSNATQMENLIGKWFLGNNRPGLTSSSYSYQYVSGSLFQNGLSANDIDQGALGDCYYVATLASIAQEKPDYIQNMFTDNGDNTFTVRFYRNGVADYVTVDRYLPTNLSGRAAYAGWGGSSYTSTTNELWVALAEKAYAQLAESGWSRSSTSTNSYADIEGGWMGSVISQVAGLGSSAADAAYMTQAQLINLVNSNQILTVGFNYAAGNTLGVVNNHAYTITAYNATNQTFHLRNPWGTRDVDVTWSQLVSLRGVMVWSNT
jgi:hypothetical protein